MGEKDEKIEIEKQKEREQKKQKKTLNTNIVTFFIKVFQVDYCKGSSDKHQRIYCGT